MWFWMRDIAWRTRKWSIERQKTIEATVNVLFSLLRSNSSRYRRLAKLKFKRRLLLTGTPIQVLRHPPKAGGNAACNHQISCTIMNHCVEQNHLGELFALLMFIMPSVSVENMKEKVCTQWTAVYKNRLGTLNMDKTWMQGKKIIPLKVQENMTKTQICNRNRSFRTQTRTISKPMRHASARC